MADNKRPEYPVGVVMTREIIQRIRSDQEAWDRQHNEKKDGRR